MKFIKLTRFDNRPVWLNASFVVTVEPRREGVGSVVVPIGDGLDYDVRESPEDVLKMLEEGIVPAVVPVPVTDGLTPTPADVSPDLELHHETSPVPKPEKPKKPRRRAVKAEVANGGEVKTAARKSSEKKAAKAFASHIELSEADVERLVRMSPKSVDKLKNTLLTQFHVADAVATVQGLEARGVIERDGKRINWKSAVSADAK